MKAEEDKKTIERSNELVSKLQNKVLLFKKQREDAVRKHIL